MIFSNYKRYSIKHFTIILNLRGQPIKFVPLTFYFKSMKLTINNCKVNSCVSNV